MSILRNLAGGTERRGISGSWGPYADGRIPPPGIEGSTSAGVVVNERTALQIIDVYACVSLRCDSVSMLPTGAYQRSGVTRTELPKQPPLAVQPDPEMEPGEYWAGMEASLLLRGNAYAAIVDRDRLGFPTSVKLLHPDDVRPRRDPNTKLIVYELANGDRLQRFDMIHVRGLTMPGEITGMGPIECARRGLGATIATEDFGAKWFRDGAAPSSVLETEQDLDELAAKRNLARWVSTHGGRRRPALLSGGLKWRPVTITPNDSQFLETKKYNTTQVARLFRIPPHMIGDLEKSTSWGSGIEEQGIGYVVYTIGPDLVRFEAAFTRQMRPPQYFKFNVGGLLRGNTKDRYAGYAIGRQWGWLSVNDIRELEDRPPIEGGDTYLQPMNMIDAAAALDSAMKTKVDAAAALVRSGYDPAAALELVGLDPIKHLGLLPVTVQPPRKGDA